MKKRITFSLADIQNSAVGAINAHLFEKTVQEPGKNSETARKPHKPHKQKDFIDVEAVRFSEKHSATLYREFKFHPAMKFRFDWAFLELKIAIEYEGINSAKSRHTTKDGYSRDTEKYNYATNLGWTVYRYTSKTYENIVHDLSLIKLKRNR